MHLKKSVAAILLAGGSATRFGGTKNKVYMPLAGRPIISYSLRALDSHVEIDEIIIVVREGEERQLGELNLTKPYKIVYGGVTRRESVYHGLQATEADIVLIHDGARPFLKSYYISDCINVMDDYPGATIAIRSKDTVKLSYENQLVMRTTNRTNTWLVQTPQCFNRETLLYAHENFGDREATDDCMMLEYFRNPVKLISGDETNIKITTKNDLMLAEFILQEKQYLQ